MHRTCDSLGNSPVLILLLLCFHLSLTFIFLILLDYLLHPSLHLLKMESELEWVFNKHPICHYCETTPCLSTQYATPWCLFCGCLIFWSLVYFVRFYFFSAVSQIKLFLHSYSIWYITQIKP